MHSNNNYDWNKQVKLIVLFLLVISLVTAQPVKSETITEEEHQKILELKRESKTGNDKFTGWEFFTTSGSAIDQDKVRVIIELEDKQDTQNNVLNNWQGLYKYMSGNSNFSIARTPSSFSYSLKSVQKPEQESISGSLYKSSDSISTFTPSVKTFIYSLQGLNFSNQESEIVVESNSGNLLQLLTPFSSLDSLKKLDGVKNIREPQYVHPHVVSEGVGVINADKLHEIGVNGEGVKVAIIDIGFENMNVGEVYNIEELKTFRGDGHMYASSHGAACAETLLDVAPNASLYLYAVSTDVEMLEAVDYAISKDVDIISMSLGLFNTGGYDGTGDVCAKVDEAYNSSIFFVVSAGNYARNHYEGEFTDENGNDIHDFSSGDEILTLGSLSTGNVIEAYLSWDDWPYSDKDYDLCLLRDNGTGWAVIKCSSQDQTGSQHPTEAIYHTSEEYATYGLSIYNNGAEKVNFDLFVPNINLPEYNVLNGSLSIPADANGSFTTGATLWSNDALESFSSRGPTNDGRIKPDIVAPDGVLNSVYFLFFGTSASAPHVAGAAALLLSANHSMTPDSLKNALENSALDLGSLGKDNLYGAGRLDVLGAFRTITDVWRVDNSSDIQDIIGLAKNGDTILFEDGIYNATLEINKTLIIRSENGSANCVINSLFNVTTDSVTITGFNFSRLNSSNFSDMRYSPFNSNTNISLRLNGANNCIITNNTFTGENGILLFNSNDSYVGNNTFRDLWWDIFVMNSTSNEFRNNSFNVNKNDVGQINTLDFDYYGDFSIANVINSEPPSNPSGNTNISRFINVTIESDGSWLILNFTGIDYPENYFRALNMWRYSPQLVWEIVSQQEQVLDSTNAIIGANITNTGIFAPLLDTIPPDSVSNIQNTTGNFWINWTWINPDNRDFNHSIIYIDGVFETNTSKPFYNYSTTPHRSHNISILTVDVTGRINYAWVNQSASIPNNPVQLNEHPNLGYLEGETVTIDLEYSDLDNDNVIFATNASKGVFNTATGVLTWETSEGDNGTYLWEFNATDGYSSSNILIQIVIWDSTPLAPFNLSSETGNFWINWTWVPGINTDSYNVIIGNESLQVTDIFYNLTSTPHAVVNISIRSYNLTLDSYSGWINQTKSIPNNFPSIMPLNDMSAFEGEEIIVDINATDLDGDNLVYSCNRTDLFNFNTSTGYGNWTTENGSSGTYYVKFGVSDGYNGTENISVKITVYDLVPPSSVTNFTSLNGTNWLYISWSNPREEDFNHIMVILNGTLVTNTTASSYNLTELAPGTQYEIRLRPVDFSGLIGPEVAENLSTKSETGLQDNDYGGGNDEGSDNSGTEGTIGGGGGGGGTFNFISSGQSESGSDLLSYSEIRYVKGTESTKPNVNISGITEIIFSPETPGIYTIIISEVDLEAQDAELPLLPSSYDAYGVFDISFFRSNRDVSNEVEGTIFLKLPANWADKDKSLILKYDRGCACNWNESSLEEVLRDEEFVYLKSDVDSYGTFAVVRIAKKPISFPTAMGGMINISGSLTGKAGTTPEEENIQLSEENISSTKGPVTPGPESTPGLGSGSTIIVLLSLSFAIFIKLYIFKD